MVLKMMYKMVLWKNETNLEDNYLAEVWFELLKSHISVGVLL